MKRYKMKLFVLPLCMLVMTACGDIMDNPDEVPANNDSSREMTITFNMDLPVVGSRAQSDANFISSGSYIDVLVYAIYNEAGELLEYFGEGAKTDVPQNFGATRIGDGQTAIPFKAGDNKTVRLSVNPTQTYRIVAWAQYSGCTAYTTTDLKKVTVSYDGVGNNDETRDAFCKSQKFSGNADNITVTLHRPFAQINVGTSGADYRTLIQGDYIYPNMTITKSQVTVSGVANTLDVVNHKAWNDVSGSNEVTFTYSNIPAFIQMGNELPAGDALWNGSKDNEEFLKVKLNSENDGFLPYKVNYPTVDKSGNYKTEIFKYLSMCYVLVPFSQQENKETTDGSVVSVKIELKDATSDGNEKSLEERTLNSVPVNANYRTNILGGLQYMKDRKPVYPTDPDDPDGPYSPTPPEDPDNPGSTIDPDDPDNPGDEPDPDIPTNQDDPTSIFNTLTFKVILEPYFLWNHFEQNNFSETQTPEPGQE